MSGSEQRRSANRANAIQSTGPVTIEGKARASQNAVRHGLLSARLILEDEAEDDFGRLVSDLQLALCPAGAVELALVERIAIAMWRERRLVTAEAAAIALSRRPSQIAGAASREIGRSYGSELKEDDMQPFDQESVAWCRTVLDEVDKLEQIDPVSLPKLAPTLYEQLQSDAKQDKETVESYLATHKDGITGYVAELLLWCHEQLRDAEQRPQVIAVAEQVRARRLILPNDAIEIFSRYQTTLDNQLYKALKALREAQEWRHKTLDGNAGTDADPLEAAA